MQSEELIVYRYRWVILISYMFVAALTQMLWLNFAPIASLVEKQFHISEMSVGYLTMIFPLLYVPISIPAGLLIDRKGFRFAVTIGAIFTAFFAVFRLAGQSYIILLIGQLGIAFGQPFVLNSIAKLSSTWFSREEGALATGLGSMALFIGMMVGMALTPELVKFYSMRTMLVVYAIASVLGIIPFLILARKSPPTPPRSPKSEYIEVPEWAGWQGFKKIMSIKNFIILLIVMFVGMGTFNGLMTWLEKILQPRGITPVQAGNIGGVMVLAGIVGCIILPALSDKIMRRKPFIILAFLVAFPTIFLIGISQTQAMLFMFAVILGFFLLSSLPIGLEFTSEIVGTELTGTATGVLMLLGNGGGVVVILVMEAIKGYTGTFFSSIIFLVAILVLSLILALFIKEKRV